MLLIQYLYAGLTLKSGDALSKLPAAVQPVVRSWRRSLMTIAIEEMGHLMSVQNLRLLLGSSPIFDREEFPPKVPVYPFTLHLEPLTKISLAKYVLAEAPFGSKQELSEYTALVPTPVRNVGVVYGLLGVLFGDSSDVTGPGDPNDNWDQFVRLMAQKSGALEKPDAWHLSEAELHPETFDFQGDPNDFLTGEEGFFCRRLKSKVEARELLRDIGLQGEAPVESDGGAVSHYRRFRKIFEGGNGLPAFPGGSDIEPAYPVATDPKLADYAGEAHTVASEIDATYASMIANLRDYLSPDRVPARADSAASALIAMTKLRTATADLLKLPQQPGSAFVASPTFTPPTHAAKD